MRSSERPLPSPEAVKRALAERSLKHFLLQAWPVLEPSTEFVDSWAIDAICEHLEAVKAGQIRDLLINVPPRSLKSTLATIAFPAWCWLSEPTLRFLCSSYAQSLATRHSVDCRRLIESPWYQRNWGARVRLTGDQNEKMRFENDRRGYRLATSVGGANVGEGGDILICDDPHNTKQAHSEVKRTEAVEWWYKVMSTRRNDPKTGRRVVVMQRVHEEDVSGAILEEGGWEHLCLPARFEADRRCVTSIGWEDPRTEEGERLNADRVPEAELDKLERDLGSDAAGQLQQRPTRKGGEILQEAYWQRYSPSERPERFDLVATFWDLTFDGKKTNDWNVGAVWGKVGARKYLLEVHRRQCGFTDQLDLFGAVARRYPDAVHVVENKANGTALMNVVKKKIPRVVAVDPDGDKVSRAWAVEPTCKAGDVFIPAGDAAWVRDWINEHSAFPKGKHDDQVDTTTMALRYLDRHGATVTADHSILDAESDEYESPWRLGR